MTKVSKWLFSMAVVFGLTGALIAHAAAKKSTPTHLSDPEYAWFQYNGSGATNVSANYGTAIASPVGCNGDDEICAIRAQIDPATNKPLQSYLSSMNLTSSNPDVTFREGEGK